MQVCVPENERETHSCTYSEREQEKVCCLLVSGPSVPFLCLTWMSKGEKAKDSAVCLRLGASCAPIGLGWDDCRWCGELAWNVLFGEKDGSFSAVRS